VSAPEGASPGAVRRFLIFAPSAAEPAYERQLALLAGHEAGLAERDLRVTSFLEDGSEEAATARGRYSVPEGRFAAVLVGKVGGAKLRSGEPLGTETLFARIDAMPMRRREMQERRSG
jgi:hypothetical protein